MYSIKTPCILRCLYSIVQLAGSSRVNFALEKDQFIVGYLTNSTLKSGVFSQLISGAGWLVRKYGKTLLLHTFIAVIFLSCTL